MNNKVSIIIPVYNGMATLLGCLQSIVEQTYEEIEVLVLDDGSEEAAAQQLDEMIDSILEYKKRIGKQLEIQVYHLEHEGVSSTRNRGIRLAQGDYVMFVDADDRLYDADVVQKFLDVMHREKVDIVVGNYVREVDGQIEQTTSHSVYHAWKQDSFAYRFSGFFSIGHLSYMWGKMFRRESLLRWDIPSYAIDYGEDKLFSFGCYLHGATYAFLEDNTYIYVRNLTSVSYQYREHYEDGWMRISHETERLAEKLESLKKYSTRNATADLIACTLLFAVFFDGKMVYEEKRDRESLRRLIAFYGDDDWARNYMRYILQPKVRRQIPNLVYRVGIPMFERALDRHHYGLISMGIRWIVHLDMDQKIKKMK